MNNRISTTVSVAGTRWKHLKTGHVVTIVGTCRLEANNEPAYLYDHDGTVWARAADQFLDGRFEKIESPAPDTGMREALEDDRMAKIGDVIADLQKIKEQFGNTCVYIRRGGMSWGAVALNYHDADSKNGVFDLVAEQDRERERHAGQVSRLMAERDELRAALSRPSHVADTRERGLLLAVEKAAREMPRRTIGPGDSSTKHAFELPAWVVWENDKALRDLEMFRALEPESLQP
jgi:hypothetical protein